MKRGKPGNERVSKKSKFVWQIVPMRWWTNMNYETVLPSSLVSSVDFTLFMTNTLRIKMLSYANILPFTIVLHSFSNTCTLYTESTHFIVTQLEKLTLFCTNRILFMTFKITLVRISIIFFWRSLCETSTFINCMMNHKLFSIVM